MSPCGSVFDRCNDIRAQETHRQLHVPCTSMQMPCRYIHVDPDVASKTLRANDIEPHRYLQIESQRRCVNRAYRRATSCFRSAFTGSLVGVCSVSPTRSPRLHLAFLPESKYSDRSGAGTAVTALPGRRADDRTSERASERPSDQTSSPRVLLPVQCQRRRIRQSDAVHERPRPLPQHGHAPVRELWRQRVQREH